MPPKVVKNTMGSKSLDEETLFLQHHFLIAGMNIATTGVLFIKEDSGVTMAPIRSAAMFSRRSLLKILCEASSNQPLKRMPSATTKRAATVMSV